jgi:hypothetical protein
MKRTNLDFALAYVILVALPLLGLAGVLRSGRTLAAPVSVGGLWRIHANLGKTGVLPCGLSLATASESITISQSGSRFALRFSNSPMSASGAIEGTTIKASLMPTAGWQREAGCDDWRVLSLTASVNSSTNPRFLAGVLSVDGCPSCAPLHFHAVREERATGGY